MLLRGRQPASKAHSRALDLHIALLRDLMLSTGAEVVEIPPVPSGYAFVACLTHDMDHPCIRLHGLDHTVAGFVYRALVTSVYRALSGRMTFRDVLRNWFAVARLPLVQLGLLEDFWAEFGRYAELEGGSTSTFFVIPLPPRTGCLVRCAKWTR
jgi:hypothetical protein